MEHFLTLSGALELKECLVLEMAHGIRLNKWITQVQPYPNTVCVAQLTITGKKGLKTGRELEKILVFYDTSNTSKDKNIQKMERHQELQKHCKNKKECRQKPKVERW